MSESIQSRFRGCLLGLAIADALGAPYEGRTPEHMRERFSTPGELLERRSAEMFYTDDTQMMIGVAETLVRRGRIDVPTLNQLFAENYTPFRGYGRGARRVLEAIRDGRDYQTAAEQTFPGGSYGNGGAMRIAPVGAYFHTQPERIMAQAKDASEPTHLHPLGYQGSQLIALAVALALRTAEAPLDRDAFFQELLQQDWAPEYVERLTLAAQSSADNLLALGNGIAALDSAPTAIACFAASPDSYQECVCAAVMLGGDCDTIAAMAGAISGARLGIEAIPSSLLQSLENREQGRSYLIDLADRLTESWRALQ